MTGHKRKDSELMRKGLAAFDVDHIKDVGDVFYLYFKRHEK
jgi:hypothetical protein